MLTFYRACTHPSPSHTLSVPSITHVHYFSLGRPPAVCVGPRLLLSGTHRSIYLSSQVCLQQSHIYVPSSLLTVHAPYVQYGSTQVHTPAPLFIDLTLAPSSPLDIVGLSHHLLDASLSLYPSLRALFASNTCRCVYELISLHIARPTIIRFHQAPIHLPR